MTDTASTTEARGRGKSGYARMKARHHGLIEQHEKLKASYDELARYQDTVDTELQRKAAECEKLLALYTSLQSDVELVLAENQKLLDTIAVLRSSATPPQPVYQPPQRPVTPPGLPSLFSRGLR